MGATRVAYVATWFGGSDTGVFKKIRDQIAQWPDQGIDPGLFVITDQGSAAAWAEVSGEVHVRLARGGRAGWSIKRRQVDDVLAWQPELAYVRGALPYPALHRLVRRTPTVVEIPVHQDGAFLARSRAVYHWNRLTRCVIYRHVRGFVYCDNEAAARAPRCFRRRPSAVIGNGIDLDRIEPLEVLPAQAPVSILFLGSPDQPWQGLDQVLELATCRPDWTFDIVGVEPPSNCPMLPNARFHGRLPYTQYREVAAGCTAGIGVLAAHRIHLRENTPLKTREYLALGLPVIGRYLDSDLPVGSAGFLALPAHGALEEDVSLIEQFLESWRGRRVPREDIAQLSSCHKEQHRVEFLRSVASGSAA